MSVAQKLEAVEMNWFYMRQSESYKIRLRYEEGEKTE